MRIARRLLLGIAALALLPACEDTAKVSADAAVRHVKEMVSTAAADVQEVRSGLPQAAPHAAELWKTEEDPSADLERAKRLLHKVRKAVQDLRIAKSTFFAFADPRGVVIRSDQQADSLAGRNLFDLLPGLKGALTTYTEARGAIPEANGVKDNRPDGQWVAAQPVLIDGQTRGLYVTGWAWSSYAYRLEFKLRGMVKKEATDDQGRINDEPLVYVYIVTPEEVVGTADAPRVNADAIKELKVLDSLTGDAVLRKQLEITGRDFGLGVARAPALGTDVAIAVLRSET